MKIIDYTNQVQKEAILNECKGNLFEFLVAQRLSQKCSSEDQFLMNLPSDFKLRLGDYEELIRKEEPKLLTFLPSLATDTANEINSRLSDKKYQFCKWAVIGKMVATNENELWNETDLVGTYKNEGGVEKNLSFSLKLSKDHSFTNTKSAGVKSFLSKYFAKFNSVDKTLVLNLQNELNVEVDESFQQMGHKLYNLADLDWGGQFSSAWSSHYSELPGELSDEMRSVVHYNYHRVALKLYSALVQLKESDSAKFFDSLASLCGFSHPDIIQVSCFHQDYQLKNITVKSLEDFFTIPVMENKNCTILPLKTMAASVDVLVGDIILQVRVKPMNKFTTAAYKINCSIKLKEKI